MSATFPAAIKSFTTRISGDTVQPAHVNDIQDEVTAIETELLEAWAAYTPTVGGGLTLGNGTAVGRFQITGKNVKGSIAVTLGSTSSVAPGIFTFSLPATAVGTGLATVTYTDSGGGVFAGGFVFSGATLLTYALLVSGSYIQLSQLTSTTPFTFSTGDTIQIAFAFEAS